MVKVIFSEGAMGPFSFWISLSLRLLPTPKFGLRFETRYLPKSEVVISFVLRDSLSF